MSKNQNQIRAVVIFLLSDKKNLSTLSFFRIYYKGEILKNGVQCDLLNISPY